MTETKHRYLYCNINELQDAVVGLVFALSLGMRVKITNRCLGYIQQQIRQQGPLWGLLVANEYLEPMDPLRLAFVRSSIDELDATNKIHRKIIGGARRQELTAKDQELVRKNISTKNFEHGKRMPLLKNREHRTLANRRITPKIALARHAQPRSLATRVVVRTFSSIQ